jgi:hypothetical protein
MSKDSKPQTDDMREVLHYIVKHLLEAIHILIQLPLNEAKQPLWIHYFIL